MICFVPYYEAPLNIVVLICPHEQKHEPSPQPIDLHIYETKYHFLQMLEYDNQNTPHIQAQNTPKPFHHVNKYLHVSVLLVLFEKSSPHEFAQNHQKTVYTQCVLLHPIQIRTHRHILHQFSTICLV